jgi:hypothetical protein
VAGLRELSAVKKSQWGTAAMIERWFVVTKKTADRLSAVINVRDLKAAQRAALLTAVFVIVFVVGLYAFAGIRVSTIGTAAGLIGARRQRHRHTQKHQRQNQYAPTDNHRLL